MLRYTEPDSSQEYDAFISYASEDKDDFVNPLADALIKRGLKVWYDTFELQIGDSIRQGIDAGLARSHFGIVVLSPSFFRKGWPQYELDGLIARQTGGERVILPIWHRLTNNELLEIAPSLTDIVSLNSLTYTIDEIASEIVKKVKGYNSQVSSVTQSYNISAPSVTSGFAVFYIAPVQTSELLPSDKPQPSFLFTQPCGWISMVHNDEELEYRLEGKTLRLRLDWGNQLSGDEIHASNIVASGDPFALTIRMTNGEQMYFPSVTNTNPSYSWTGRQSKSGWLVFEIQ